jgi:hypothetical protein
VAIERRATQKLLDRVLFCAFAEDRGLLPVDTIRKAYEHRDPYHPRPIWENFRGLFAAVNRGNAGLGIHAYNGGLFADDPLLDRLQVADAVCGYFRDLGSYDYRPAASSRLVRAGASLIDVDILGHIFEQSITDLERLRNELDGLAEPVGRRPHKTRRKKEGAFYTPAFITRYIIEQALGGVLRDRFEQLRQQHAHQMPRARPAPRWPIRACTNWKAESPAARGAGPVLGSVAGPVGRHPAAGPGLRQRRVLDRSLRPVAHRLPGVQRPAAGAARHRSLFDLDRRILEHNLYGVDLNDEAIEICRLSLWIKTAQRGKPLASLDHPIRVGNSVVADPAVHGVASMPVLG